MNYTDKEIQIAPQISYINISNDYVNEYYNNHHDYPTLAEIFIENTN